MRERLRCAVCAIQMDARRGRGEERIYCSGACRQKARRRRERLLEGGSGYKGGRQPRGWNGRAVWIVQTLTGYAVFTDDGYMRDEAPDFERAWRLACRETRTIWEIGYEPALQFCDNSKQSDLI
jgi:hypothetical protein